VVLKKMKKNKKLLLTMKRTRAIINKLTAGNTDSTQRTLITEQRKTLKDLKIDGEKIS
jgi:hypothetical protein